MTVDMERVLCERGRLYAGDGIPLDSLLSSMIPLIAGEYARAYVPEGEPGHRITLGSQIEVLVDVHVTSRSLETIHYLSAALIRSVLTQAASEEGSIEALERHSEGALAVYRRIAGREHLSTEPLGKARDVALGIIRPLMEGYILGSRN